jgi:hypothetical protein
MAAWLVARSSSPTAGFSLSLWIATAMLMLGAAVYVMMARCFPVKAPDWVR